MMFLWIVLFVFAAFALEAFAIWRIEKIKKNKGDHENR
jgi:hypothetical protein